MKNESGFIISKYIQPDYYTKFFGNWAAIYWIGDTEYHVEGVCDPYDIEDKTFVGFQILKQHKSGRSYLQDCGKGYNNVKIALNIIETLMLNHRKDEEENMKKFIMAENTGNNVYKVVIVEGESREFLNFEHTNFKSADNSAKENSLIFNAEYVNNR